MARVRCIESTLRPGGGDEISRPWWRTSTMIQSTARENRAQTVRCLESRTNFLACVGWGESTRATPAGSNLYSLVKPPAAALRQDALYDREGVCLPLGRHDLGQHHLTDPAGTVARGARVGRPIGEAPEALDTPEPHHPGSSPKKLGARESPDLDCSAPAPEMRASQPSNCGPALSCRDRSLYGRHDPRPWSLPPCLASRGDRRMRIPSRPSLEM